MNHSRNTQSTTQSVPEFSEAQYEYLRRVFRRADITPSSTTQEIMYSAGEQNVLKHVASKVKVWNKTRILPEL